MVLAGLMFVFGQFLVSGQCNIQICIDTTPLDSIEICLGDSLSISATGECILLSESFDNMAFGSTEWIYYPPNIQYTNPCMSSANGSSYAWFGAACPPTREIVTKDFDLMAGGYISFDLRYGLQGANTPCDGPDAMREGVSLQYSTDYGDNWHDIAYFAPTGSVLPSNPFTTLPTTFGPTMFTSWGNYVFQIPAGACTPHTRIRWAQYYINYYNGHFDDSWGIDNILISRSIELDTRWDFGSDTTSPGFVHPTGDSVFIAYLLDYHFPYDTIASDTLAVWVHQMPEFDFLMDTNRICLRDSLSIHLTGAYAYQWSNGLLGNAVTVSPSADALFTVTGTDDIGCSSEDSLWIYVEPLPVIHLTGDTVCAGDTAILSASGGVRYEWREGDTLASIQVVPQHSTIYHITVTGANNCKDTGSVLSYVWQLPQGTSSEDTTICFGGEVILWASGGVEYQWSDGAHTPSITVSPKMDELFFVTITDDHQCAVRDSVLVRVNPLREVLLEANPDTVCRGTSSLINALGGVEYIWSTGAYGSQIEVWPGSPTVYHVTATETYAGLTCMLTNSIYLYVEECNTLHMANAFNPEGYTNVFKPIGNFFSISDYYFAIYDRWGRMIFETHNWDEGWDGRIHGAPAPNGAYVYLVKFTKEYVDQTFERIGTVTVIR